MTATDGSHYRPPSVKHVVAVVIGNGLEFFDFLTYVYFAAQIGRTFFPADKPITSLLASLATFGAGFITRPIGAFVIGRIADRVGRKPAMLLSFSLMGLAMAGIGLTPGFATIGIFGPILAISFRLLQGFALGGELGSSTAYMIEAAPRRRRGLFVSLQYMGQDAATLAAGMFGVVLSSQLSATSLDNWGWRVPFLVGSIIVPFGLMLRNSLVETLEPPAVANAEAVPKPDQLKGYMGIALFGLVTLASGTIVGYTLNYLTTYANSTLNMPTTLAFGATVVTGLVGVVFDPLGGWLSDRYGRRPVMIWPWLALLIAVWPSFWLIEHFRTGWALFTGTAVLSVLASVSSSSNLVALTEALPPRVRAGSLAMIYALAISIFGGSTQFVVAWLSDLTKNPLTPAFYMMVAVAVGFVAMCFRAETAPVIVDKAGA